MHSEFDYMFKPISKLSSGQNLYATYCISERIHGLCHGKVFSGYTRERHFPLFSLLWWLTSWTEGFFLAQRSGLQLWVSATYHQGLRVHGTVSLYVCVSVCGRFFRAEQRAGMASEQPLPTRTKTSHTSSLRWHRGRQNKQTKGSESSVTPCHCKHHTVFFLS